MAPRCGDEGRHLTETEDRTGQWDCGVIYSQVPDIRTQTSLGRRHSAYHMESLIWSTFYSGLPDSSLSP